MKIQCINRKSIVGIGLCLAIAASSLIFTLPVMADDSANASVSISPSTLLVASGASFSVDLVINTVTPIRGWQIDINFDASKLQCTRVTEGSFLRDFAQANGGSTYWQAPQIDNASGKITNAICVIMGARAADYVPLGITGSGTLCTLSFTVQPNVNSTCSVTPVNVLLCDTNMDLIPTVVINAASVGIGDVSTPLVVPPPTTQITPTPTQTATVPAQTPAPTTVVPLTKQTYVTPPAWAAIPVLPPVSSLAPDTVFTKIDAPLSVDVNQDGTIPTGSIIRHRTDGITEVFDSQGNLLFRALDSQAASIPSPDGPMQATWVTPAPANSFINTEGNVTRIYSNNVLILTIIIGDVPNTAPDTVTAPIPVPTIIPAASPTSANNLNPIPLIGAAFILQTGYIGLPILFKKRRASTGKGSDIEPQ